MLARDLERNLAAGHEIKGKPTNADLSLQPGLTLSIKVQDADGRPIPSATEALAFKLENTDWSLRRIPARADEHGVVEIKALPQGLIYSASITSRGFSTETVEAPLEATLTNHLELPPATLRVKDH
jgi:hypothetical protein